jgi:hypothetical protein
MAWLYRLAKKRCVGEAYGALNASTDTQDSVSAEDLNGSEDLESGCPVAWTFPVGTSDVPESDSEDH